MITAEIRSRQQAGSCNSCQRRDQEIVIEIALNTTTFRVCDECARELSKRLGWVLSPTPGADVAGVKGANDEQVLQSTK